MGVWVVNWEIGEIGRNYTIRCLRWLRVFLRCWCGGEWRVNFDCCDCVCCGWVCGWWIWWGARVGWFRRRREIVRDRRRKRCWEDGFGSFCFWVGVWWEGGKWCVCLVWVNVRCWWCFWCDVFCFWTRGVAEDSSFRARTA